MGTGIQYTDHEQLVDFESVSRLHDIQNNVYLLASFKSLILME